MRMATRHVVVRASNAPTATTTTTLLFLIVIFSLPPIVKTWSFATHKPFSLLRPPPLLFSPSPSKNHESLFQQQDQVQQLQQQQQQKSTTKNGQNNNRNNNIIIHDGPRIIHERFAGTTNRPTPEDNAMKDKKRRPMVTIPAPPRYEVLEDEEKFQITVDLPNGIDMKELRVSLMEDENNIHMKILTIEGRQHHAIASTSSSSSSLSDDDCDPDGRREEEEVSVETFCSKFSERFALDGSVVDTTKLTAKTIIQKDCDSRILLVTVPKDLLRIQSAVRIIPITEGSSCAEQQIYKDAGEPIEV